MEPSHASAAVRGDYLLQCLTNNIFFPGPKNYLDLSFPKEHVLQQGKFGPPFPLLLGGEGATREGEVTPAQLRGLAGAIGTAKLLGFRGVIDLSGNPIRDEHAVELLQAAQRSESVTGEQKAAKRKEDRGRRRP